LSANAGHSLKYPIVHIQTEHVIPFAELNPSQYARERTFKQALRAVRYYQVFIPRKPL
jgi:hypothetical protein